MGLVNSAVVGLVNSAVVGLVNSAAALLRLRGWTIATRKFHDT